jgi:3-oxoacyl-[acyl-carrier protein] reductase
VEPGTVLTEGAKEVLRDEDIKRIAESIPTKRLADPQDIAFAALFLSTDESKYITGQSIMVEGGLLRPEWPLPLIERIFA